MSAKRISTEVSWNLIVSIYTNNIFTNANTVQLSQPPLVLAGIATFLSSAWSAFPPASSSVLPNYSNTFLIQQSFVSSLLGACRIIGY